MYSWEITNKVATQIEITVDGLEKTVAALMMDVNGFNYQGRLYVTNNRVKQTFGLYSEQNGMLHKENENIRQRTCKKRCEHHLLPIASYNTDKRYQ